MALIQICLVFIVALEGSYAVSTSNEQQPQIVKARLGEDVTLKCVSEVNETLISVRWNKLNYSDETTNSRISIKGGHLVIENLQIADAGLYECDAFFGDEIDPMRSQTISLEVEVKDMYAVGYPRAADVGEDVVMPCGSSPDEREYYVYWYKYATNRTLLVSKMSAGEQTKKSGRGYMIQNGTDLLIPNATKDDSGTYQCAVFSHKRLNQNQYNSSLLVGVSTCTLRIYHESNYGNLTSNCSSNETVSYNTKCSFKCDDSSILLGRPLLTCGASDTFDYSFPTCHVPTCTLPSYHESNYGNLTSNCSSNETVRYTTKCSFKCDDSSILLGIPLLTCGANNTFDYPFPTCRDKNKDAYVYHHTVDVGGNVVMPCGSAPAEDEYDVYWKKNETNIIVLHKTSAGEKNNYSDRGYRIQNGTDLWIPNANKGDSGAYQCAVFSYEKYKWYLYNSSLSVRVPTCTLRIYHESNYGNLASNCSSNETVPYNTKCIFRCDDSSILLGRLLLTCGANDTFDHPFPTCLGKNTYAVVYPHTVDVGEDAVMPCGSAPTEDDYWVFWYKYGTNKTLLLSKTSAGEHTYSVRGYQIQNGVELVIPNTTKGDSGTYQCDVFDHVRFHTYPYNSSLSVRGNCKMPTFDVALHTNTTTCRSEATIVEGRSCHFYCNSNYKLVGQGSTKCLENGSLSEHVPSCRPKEELNGGEPLNTLWIFIISLVLLNFGAFVAFCIYKLRKWKTGDYSGVSRADGEAGLQPSASDPIHLDIPVTSHARSHHKDHVIDGQ